MKTVVEFPERSVVVEEAAEWLIRLDADTPPNDQELRALGEWLRRSPVHREELENLASLWGRMNALTELAVPLGRPARSMGAACRRNARAATRWPGQRLGLLTGSLVALVALAFNPLLWEPTTDPLFQSNGLYATAVGQQKTTTLADGTEVILNTNSQIKVDYVDEYRDIHLLQGEAHFTVAKDMERPFRVYAGSGRIQALGTIFSVYISGEDVNITVAEGRVSLASVTALRLSLQQPSTDPAAFRGSDRVGSQPKDDIVDSLGTLTAGQVATIRGSVAEAAGSVSTLETSGPVPAEELAQRLAWRKGILMFSGERLEDVVNEIGRYTTVSIDIPDAAVRDMRVGGRFPVGETEAMLSELERNFHLQVTHLSHNRVVLSAANE